MACNPPKFADLGKDAKDLLSKNFHHGVIKLEGKTTCQAGTEFNLSGTQNGDSVSAELETKMVQPKFTLKEKWTTDNTLISNVALNGNLIKGVKADVDYKLWPASGKQEAKLNTAFANEWLNTTHDVDITAGPTIHASGVTGYNGFMVGASTAYNAGSSQAKNTQVGMAYHGQDFKVNAAIADFSKVQASIFHKANPNVSVGASFAWSNDAASPSLVVAAQKQLSANSSAKVKLDNNLQAGLSYQTKLADGVQVTLSSHVNAKNINGGGHRIGAAFNFTA